MVRGTVASGQKARAAWRAKRALRISSLERDTTGHQPVDIRRSDMRIAQRADRVVALSVSAIPEDVGFFVRSHRTRLSLLPDIRIQNPHGSSAQNSLWTKCGKAEPH